MTQYHADRRKIDPTRGDRLGDGTPNDNDRVEIGPTQLAFSEWAAAGLQLPNLEAMRHDRWHRLTQALAARPHKAMADRIRLKLDKGLTAPAPKKRTPPKVDLTPSKPASAA